MSDKRRISEKRPEAEKREKPEKTVSLAPAEKPLPGLQSPEEFVSNIIRSLEATGQVISKIVEDKDKRNGAFTVASGMADSGKLFAPIVQYWMNDPKAYAEAQAKLSADMIDLWGRTYKRFLGEKVEPMVAPSAHDPRFADKEWTDNAFFDFLKQAYLLAGKWAEDMVHNATTVDAHVKHRAEFYLNQIVSALSPSNFPFTNPEVIRATVSTNAKNLAEGMTHLLEDLNRSGELLRIRQTDMSAFEVGKNLAVTPGKVVYQNELLQLIQYSPTTETVHEVPMLIVPPWINKFYILDLTPPKSFIKWLVDQGFTVFVISWVNPDERLASKTFEDYMLEGVVAAVGATLRITGQPHTNTLGYCVGGTLLACTLAYMAATDDHRINSATLFTAQTDFTKAGDLLVFIDDEQLKALEDLMAEKGFLDGARMAATFNALRPKDLIWPYVVNNYLLGKQPFPFDLLFWNADSTRMPAANHSFYLREFYKNNTLAQGFLKLGGVTLDLSKITVPIYDVAAKEDHIAPAQSVLNGAKLFSGPVRFVLAGSGHIAGVINPPAKQKYQYWILEEGDAKVLPTIDAFIAKAQEHPGSWWPDYKKWLSSQSGAQVAPPQPGGGVFKPIEDAPGSYVRK
jgi:polyhydroxyalkanoate synthase subunit PhaC